MQSEFDKARRSFGKLAGVNNDPMAQHTIADLVFAAQFEIDLFEEGDSELKASEIKPIRKFVQTYQNR